MTRRTMFSAVVLAVTLAAGAPAQERGDSVRVSLRDGNRIEGRLLSLDSSELAVRWRLDDHTYALSEVERLEAWRRKDPAAPVLGLMVIGGILGATVPKQLSSDEEPLTGSVAGDVAVFAGGGALLGLIIYTLMGGGWDEVELPMPVSFAPERNGRFGLQVLVRF